MSTSTPAITLEEFQALPDDGIERYVLRGELVEVRDPQAPSMTVRNRWHSRVQVKISTVLENWSQESAPPRGLVYAGEAGCIIRDEPFTLFGIDVALFAGVASAESTSEGVYLDGPPLLAVEILSPSDVHENIVDKIREYLACGVAVVWTVDPDLRLLHVHRQGRVPQMFTIDDQFNGDPELPGLRFAVADVFREV